MDMSASYRTGTMAEAIQHPGRECCGLVAYFGMAVVS